MVCEIRPSFFELLRSVDYRLFLEKPAHTSIEKYIVIRAQIILGHFDRAEKQLSACKRNGPLSEDLFCFLKSQLLLYRDRNFSKTKTLFERPQFNFTTNDYLRAEYHFVLGYFFSLQDNYQAASLHYSTARGIYEEINLPGQSAISIFNLAVCDNHLGSSEDLHLQLKKLKSLHSQHIEIRAIHQVLCRLSSYLNIDNENYEKAEVLLKKAIAIYGQDKRWTDQYGLLCILAYVHLKTEALTKFQQLSLPRSAETPYRQVFEEFVHLSEIGLPELKQCLHLTKRWLNSSLPSIYVLFLWDLLCQKVAKTSDMKLLKSLAKKGRQYSLSKQQILRLTDLRYYEILAYISLGELKKAEPLLNIYSSESPSQPKQKKSAELSHFLHRTRRQSQMTRRHLLKICPIRKTLFFDDSRLSLEHQPRIFDFFRILTLQAKGISLEDIFLKLYGEHYDPIMHGSRLSALLTRAREVLPERKMILRRDGKLSFSHCVQVEVLGRALSAEIRRQKLQGLIETFDRPVSISQLEHYFECTRRTLQLDLSDLAKKKIISVQGSTKGATYFFNRTTDCE